MSSQYNIIRYSTDGINWTEVTGIPNNVNTYNWKSIAYGNGIYVFAGNNYIGYSYDAATWTTKSVSYGAAGFIRFDGEKFLIINSNGKIATSTDGLTYTISSLPSMTGKTLTSFQYCNNMYIILFDQGYLWYSSDATNWTTTARIATVNSAWYSITYGKGLYVTVGSNSWIAYSSNLTAWTTIMWNVSGIAGNIYLNEIIYGGGLFVICGSSANTLYSTDGINWTPESVNNNRSASWKCGCYANGMFIISSSGDSTTSFAYKYWYPDLEYIE